MANSSKTEMQGKDRALICGQIVVVKKDSYDGLWNIKYEDGMRYAGPFATRKEARERLVKAVQP